jgi:hypothetical protein
MPDLETFSVILIHSVSHILHNVCNADTGTSQYGFDVLITERCWWFWVGGCLYAVITEHVVN